MYSQLIHLNMHETRKFSPQSYIERRFILTKVTLNQVKNKSRENPKETLSHLMSPNDTSSLDKRSWGRAQNFQNDLEYIELELEWIKARCDWFNYKKRTISNQPRRRWIEDDDENLTPSRLNKAINSKKKAEQTLRKAINRRLQAHRASDSQQLRIDTLSEKCGLNDFHRTILILALAPCFSKQFADYYEHVGDRYSALSVETIFTYFEFSFVERIEYRSEFSTISPLITNELLDLDFRRRYEGARDLLDATIEIDNRTFSYLIGRDELTDEFLEFSSVQEPLANMEQVVLPTEDKQRILSIVDDHDRYLDYRSKWGFDERISYGKGSMMLFYGKPGTGKTMTAHAVAHHLNKRILNVDIPTFIAHRDAQRFLPGLFREAKIQNAILFFDECEMLFSDRRGGNMLVTLLLTELEQFEGVAIFATNIPRILDEAFQRRILVRVNFLEPDLQSRAEIWRSLIPKQAPISEDVDFDLLGARFEITGGYIKNAVLSAIAESVHSVEAHTSPSINMKMLENAARHQLNLVEDFDVEGLSIPQVRLKDVILEEEASNHVQRIIDAVRYLPSVLHRWKMGGTGGERGGIVALFHGPPGTGKTLCAEAIAGELNRPIKITRSSTILSKWVGESERNLEKIFKDARAHNAVLFIDEADSLVEKREGSNNSHTRSLVNLLLSLIERHNGLVLLATNHREHLDTALERRVTHQINLQRPQADTRLRLWSNMLPKSAPGVAEIDFDTLAKEYDLSGAEIRVAILRAATTAAAQKINLNHELMENEIKAMLGGKVKKSTIGFTRRIS
jgi:SpoVK/Ycf46/Vps4 family AAA+-type ATPase